MDKVDKKIALYEKLGAKKMQKFVFNIEEKKWKIIKKLVPNYIKYADNFIDNNRKYALKHSKTEEEKDKINKTATMQKMVVRKEYNSNHNYNYHISKTSPVEFLEQLNWNRDVHTKGLILDACVIPVLAYGVTHNVYVFAPLLAYEAFSAFLNFQCINVQNYNINRIKRIENKLKEKEQREFERNNKQYSEAYELVSNTLEEKKDIVSIDELVDKIKTKEQLEQLKEIIKKEKAERKTDKNIGGKKYVRTN